PNWHDPAVEPDCRGGVVKEEIAKIKSTFLGYEDHGILTAFVQLEYGGSGQGAGGYAFDEWDGEKRIFGSEGMEFVAGVLRACGVDSWEKLPGRPVFAIRDAAGWGGSVIGLKPLPTQ